MERSEGVKGKVINLKDNYKKATKINFRIGNFLAVL